jgi:hypothetical protein
MVAGLGVSLLAEITQLFTNDVHRFRSLDPDAN